MVATPFFPWLVPRGVILDPTVHPPASPVSVGFTVDPASMPSSRTTSTTSILSQTPWPALGLGDQPWGGDPPSSPPCNLLSPRQPGVFVNFCQVTAQHKPSSPNKIQILATSYLPLPVRSAPLSSLSLPFSKLRAASGPLHQLIPTSSFRIISLEPSLDTGPGGFLPQTLYASL